MCSWQARYIHNNQPIAVRAIGIAIDPTSARNASTASDDSTGSTGSTSGGGKLLRCFVTDRSNVLLRIACSQPMPSAATIITASERSDLLIARLNAGRAINVRSELVAGVPDRTGNTGLSGDGIGPEARFFQPTQIVCSRDGGMCYIVDGCRIRSFNTRTRLVQTELTTTDKLIHSIALKSTAGSGAGSVVRETELYFATASEIYHYNILRGNTRLVADAKQLGVALHITSIACFQSSGLILIACEKTHSIYLLDLFNPPARRIAGTGSAGKPQTISAGAAVTTALNRPISLSLSRHCETTTASGRGSSGDRNGSGSGGGDDWDERFVHFIEAGRQSVRRIGPFFL